MRRVLLLAALLVAGCDTSPEYSFPGCNDAGGPGTCTQFQVFACAQATLVAEANACTTSSDCVVFTQPTCSATCPVAINAEHAGSFRDRLANESARFCKSLRCQGTFDASCSFFLQRAACDAGRCVLAPLNDGGT